MKIFKYFIFVLALFLPSFCYAGFKDTPHIPILEYHSVGVTESRWTRSIENFRKDLEWLYNNDYVLVKASEYADMSFKLPRGKKPVVMTFDDGNENQFKYLADGTIDPDCAIGIMDAFYEEHPSFGRAAVFYLNALPFGNDEQAQSKILYLMATGREIGNHTLNHSKLSELSYDSTIQQLGALVKKVSEYAGTSVPIVTTAYPHGLVPVHEDAFKNGLWEGYHYQNKVGFLVGAEPALLPTDPNYDSLRVPRIQAIDDEWKRWFNRGIASATAKVEENFMAYEYEFPKNFPYQHCDDPNAEKYVLRKKLGISFSSLRGFLMSFFKKEVKVEPRGIYLTTSSILSDNGRKLVEKLVESGGNMVVFDVLPAGRLIPFPGETEIDQDYIEKVKDFMAFLDEKGIYKVARYVLFKDPSLAARRPSWLLKSRAGGGIWSGDGGPVWLDSSMPEVQDYILEATARVAALGVDEIQYDYVRFPTATNSKDTSYYSMREAFAAGKEIPTKWMVIRDFLKRASDVVYPYGVDLGVDLYGIVAWNDGYDANSTGQKTECLAPYVDVIYPMIYPSHFGPGFAGWANPADEPYHFVKKSSELFLELMEGTETELRPWLQGFAMRVSNYGSWYVPEQRRALNDIGWDQFVIWNASNVYDLHWGAFK